MKEITLGTLCEVLRSVCPPEAEALTAGGVSIDSRTIRPGEIFFAIAGEKFDGHDYIEKARQGGAVCAVVQREVPNAGIPIVRVSDTLKALAQLAVWHRSRIRASVIGITGSAGKTSTRQILHHVLSRKYRCCQAPKSFNNIIGVPLTLLAAEPEDDYLLVEMGSNHPGEIAALTEIVQPDIAVITHIAPAHLEGFGSIPAIIEEKASIIKGLRPHGKLFINGDVPELAAYIRRAYPVPFTLVGTESYCDIRADRLHCAGSNGWLSIEGRTVNVPLAGLASLRNVLTVWSVCRESGISLSDFAEAIRTVQPARMRLEIEHIGPLTILNDCYNANPASMENALDCLQRLSSEQKRRSVFITGDMKELGIHGPFLHKQLGRMAAMHKVDLILAAGEFAETVLEGAQKTDNPNATVPQTRTFGSVDALCNNVHRYIRPDDIILVKASRSFCMERVVDQLRDLFAKQQRI